MKNNSVMNNIPFFSIIIPVYNVEKYLLECIDSILNQSYKDFEVIFVDDGSTDNSGKLCDGFSKKYSFIKVIHQENKGLLAARRTGLKKAKGKYIVHVDSDDKCCKTLLQELKSEINISLPDILIYDFYFYKNHKRKRYKYFEDSRLEFNKEKFLEKMLENPFLNSMWIKCSKREIVDIDNDYSEYGRLNLEEDYLQTVGMLEKANKIVYISKPLYYYRQNSVSIMSNFKVDYTFDDIKAKKKMQTLLHSVGNSKLEKLFYKTYLHELNKNIMKSAAICTSSKQFYQYRNNVKKCEIPYNKFKVDSLFERNIYRFYEKHMFFLQHLISGLYFKRKL